MSEANKNETSEAPTKIGPDEIDAIREKLEKKAAIKKQEKLEREAEKRMVREKLRAHDTGEEVPPESEPVSKGSRHGEKVTWLNELVAAQRSALKEYRDERTSEEKALRKAFREFRQAQIREEQKRKAEMWLRIAEMHEEIESFDKRQSERLAQARKSLFGEPSK